MGGGLADNGGPVATVALAQLRSNLAIDTGDDFLDAPADARGAARADVPGVAHNGASISDLGPFEVQASGALEAESLVVTTADDVLDWTDGVTSLREALVLANSAASGGDALGDGLPDVITFASALARQTLTLTQGQLMISSDVTTTATRPATTTCPTSVGRRGAIHRSASTPRRILRPIPTLRRRTAAR